MHLRLPLFLPLLLLFTNISHTTLALTSPQNPPPLAATPATPDRDARDLIPFPPYIFAPRGEFVPTNPTVHMTTISRVPLGRAATDGTTVGMRMRPRRGGSARGALVGFAGGGEEVEDEDEGVVEDLIHPATFDDDAEVAGSMVALVD
ncbi:hypothetical protein HK102_011196 [Quaeritorhiza haematococci]|nr:hypothetical protein HK102_011196 [Quaeritorhiza haematococci]